MTTTSIAKADDIPVETNVPTISSAQRLPAEFARNVRIRCARAAEISNVADWVSEQGRLHYHVLRQLGPHEFYGTQTWVERTHAGRRKAWEDPTCISLVATVPHQPSSGQQSSSGCEKVYLTPDGRERIVGMVEYGPMRFYADLQKYEDVPQWEIYTLYADNCMAGTGLGKQLVGEAMARMMAVPISSTSSAATTREREDEKPIPTRRMVEGDTCCVLTLQENPAKGFYTKLGGKYIYDLPGYPVSKTRSWRTGRWSSWADGLAHVIHRLVRSGRPDDVGHRPAL